MEKKVRYYLFAGAFLGVQILSFGQFSSNNPPEPNFSEDTLESPCGSGDGGNDGGISPPVGLCLPINDYLLPLFISGVSLGAFSLFSLQKKQEIRNAAL